MSCVVALSGTSIKATKTKPTHDRGPNNVLFTKLKKRAERQIIMCIHHKEKSEENKNSFMTLLSPFPIFSPFISQFTFYSRAILSYRDNENETSITATLNGAYCYNA